LLCLFKDKTQLINSINALQYNPGGNGPINFSGALQEARINQFSIGRGKRLGAQDILILLTNGESAVSQVRTSLLIQVRI
jgi:von Willebrand factor type A domain